MKKSKKIQDRENSVLEAQLNTARLEYETGTITFKNAKGQERSLPYARVDRNGRFVGDAGTEPEAWADYVAVSFRTQHEQKRSVLRGEAKLRVRCGHSIKMGVASCGWNTSKMTASKSETCVQWADAQKLARTIDAIQAELDRRNEIERLKVEAELAAKASEQQNAEVLAALNGTAVQKAA